MIFVNPLVLFGLFAAVLPLLVHLFNFRRPTRLDYSSIALLQSLQRTTMQRVRIRNWVLLILRTLAICALIFVFARPTLIGISGTSLLGPSSVSVLLALDVSLSMMQRDAEGTRMSQAVSIAGLITQSVDPEDEIFILSGDPRDSQTVNMLDELRPTYVTQSAASTIRQAAEFIDRTATHPSKIIYHLGDLQSATLIDSVQTPLEAEVRVVMIPVGAPQTRANVGVANVQVISQMIDVGSPVRVEATVVNYGGVTIDDYAVSMYLDNRRVAQTSVTLVPEVPIRVVLQAVPETRGWIEGYVMIEDDEFEEDNQRYFTINVPEQRNILVVHGANAQTAQVELALSLRDESSGLQTTRILQRGLVAAPIDQYSAIYLISPEELSSGEVAKLERYVHDGGGLFIFPGADPVPINLLFETFGAGRITIQEWETSIESADFEHPLFEGVFTASDRAQRVESVRVSRAARYVPGTGAEQTLIRLLGESPLLQEIQFNNGYILFLAVAPDASWSDLPLRGLFVPLMVRAAHYLSAGGSVQGEQFLVGQRAAIRIPAAQGEISLELPNGIELIPDQRQIFGATLIEFESNTPGIVKILVDQVPERMVSIGLDPNESRLSYAEPDESGEVLSEALGKTVEVLEVDSPNEIPLAMRQARTGVELWRHFLVLGLLCLTAEMMLTTRWKDR